MVKSSPIHPAPSFSPLGYRIPPTRLTRLADQIGVSESAFRIFMDVGFVAKFKRTEFCTVIRRKIMNKCSKYGVSSKFLINLFRDI